MNFKSKADIFPVDEFNKCGELYRSPVINNKQYMFLSCIYCKNISWELDSFLDHLDSKHHKIDICLNLFKEDIIIEENSEKFKNETNSGVKYYSNSYTDCENDPLDEKNCDYSELLPVDVKIEKAVYDNCNEDNLRPETEIIKEDDSTMKANRIINDFKYDEKKHSSNGPGKFSVEDKIDESSGEHLNENYDDNESEDNKFSSKPFENSLKKSVKHLTKNREFIKSLINAYQKNTILWDNTYKTKKITRSEKQEALKTIWCDMKEKFKITRSLQQIECVIKRLKFRFAHYLRLKDKGEAYKPLWFFELLNFLEPHLNKSKSKTGVCKQLNENQFLKLVSILKENECFWNENNIYHTSITNKQEILNRVTREFTKLCDIINFNVDIMQNTIDEVIDMARKENIKMTQGLKSENSDKYQSSNKFYKDIEFLLPHVGPFKCMYCSKTFTDIYTYKYHTSRHEGTKPFKCMECLKELTHKKEFICHLRRHTKECPFQCSSCEKSFPSQKEWHRHIIKHGSKPYVCELCADSFYTQHQLTNHMKNHNNIKDHVCPECGKGFTHRGLLRQHLQTHNKIKCFCTICDNMYSNPRSLRKHYVRVHESVEQTSASPKTQYNCHICKIKFSTLQDAKQHRKEHKQSNPAERKHVCDICGHYFAYPRNLADHKKTHSNIRDQVCDVCGKAFTNANLLNQHKNVHTGEKFVCKACGKDYAHYRGLCRHITKVHCSNIRDLDALLEKQKISPASQ